MTSGEKIIFRGKASSGCGGIIAVPFFAVFLVMGLFFEGLAARDFLRTARTYGWSRTPCEIISSNVRDTDEQGRPASEYSLEVNYRYTFRGGSYTARQFMLQAKSFADYGEAQRLVRRYPAGAESVCYVNPASPGEAILRRGSLWFGLVLLFPLIFVAIGAGGIWFTLRTLFRRGQAAAPGRLPSGPISDQAQAGRGRLFGGLFFGLFLGAGLVAFFFLTVRPLWRSLEARGWRATPCEVVSSEVKSHSSDDGTTYSVNILYRYVVDDHEYRANRYHFMGGSSSGYSGKARIVARYPPGSKTVCYVNPRDPTDAVLERGLTADLWFGLIPLVFVVVGAGGMWLTLRRRQSGGAPGRSRWTTQSVRDPSRFQTTAVSAPENDPVPRVLRPGPGPVGKLIGAIVVTAFWNGIVSVFVREAIKGWQNHHPEWFLTLFMIPFVAIGLVMIGAVVYFLLALFNPRPTLTVTPGAVRLGDRLEVQWLFRGRAEVIERLRIWLEGREEAQYQRGTSTSTDKSVFATLELVSTADRLAVRSGQARLTVPPNLMHSWSADHNKIVWAVRVHGDIPRWPDVKEEFPLTVLPAENKLLPSP